MMKINVCCESLIINIEAALTQIRYFKFFFLIFVLINFKIDLVEIYILILSKSNIIINNVFDCFSMMKGIEACALKDGF